MHMRDNNSVLTSSHIFHFFLLKIRNHFVLSYLPFSRPLLPFDFLVDVFAFLPLVKVDSDAGVNNYIFEGQLFPSSEASRLAYPAASKTSRLRECWLPPFQRFYSNVVVYPLIISKATITHVPSGHTSSRPSSIEVACRGQNRC
jgi:hypothetical protein